VLVQLFKLAVVASHVVIATAAPALEVVRKRRSDLLFDADLCFGIIHGSFHRRRRFARAKVTVGIFPDSTQVEQIALLRHTQ